MDVRWIIGFILTVHTGASVFASPCSSTNRNANLQACLDSIQTAMFNTTSFWFGTEYDTMCPNGQDGSLRCVNSLPSSRSIATRLFAKNEHNPTLDRYLDMTFTSIQKNYSGCGVTYTATGSDVWRKTVDPLSTDVEEPWFLRNRPSMSWTSQTGEYFTLIVYDAGYPVAHAVYANIQGNDIFNSQVIRSYRGPHISIDLSNPYVFLLYSHNTELNINQTLKDLITGVRPNALGEFLDALGLQGPVAVNWVTVTGDIYAAQQEIDASHKFTCPVFSTKALMSKPRPFLPTTTRLDVWLDIQFQTTKINFTACCRHYDMPAKQFKLTPIANPIYPTEDVRTEAVLTYNAQKMGSYHNRNNFTNEIHMLVSFDPDVPSAEVGTEEKPLLHGLMVNIQAGDFSTGDTPRAYSGPTPPDNTDHWYYFLLYKQNGTVDGTYIQNTYTDATCRIPGRCLFDINKLVEDYDLQLVGASWLRAETDPYVIYRRVNSDASVESGYCSGKPGYGNPCPTAGATVASGATTTFVIMVLSVFHQLL